jgi:drug/metabolite transporter (DMT)-like permease
MGIFGKLAYDDGASVSTLLSARFGIAAVLLWLVIVATGGRARLAGIARRDVGIALALGAVGYSAQAGAYFVALRHLDASLLVMLVYTFPAMVTIAAIALGRERASRRTTVALGLASAGLVLVLAGAAEASLDVVGTVLGLSAAVVYTGYILGSEGVTARVDALVLSALVCTGAAATVTLAGAIGGDLDPGHVGFAGAGWLAAVAIISTVVAITLFFAGLRRVGATAAAILSCLEPLVTTILAVAALGEAPTALQIAGGALVLSAVLVLRVVRTPGRQPCPAP